MVEEDDSWYSGVTSRNVQFEYFGNVGYNLMVLGDETALRFAKKVEQKANEQHKDCRLNFVPVQTLKYGYKSVIFDEQLKYKICPGNRQDAYFMYENSVKICIIIDPVSLLFDSYSTCNKINDQQAKILGMETVYTTETCLYQSSERIGEPMMYVDVLCNPELHGISKTTIKSFLSGCVDAKNELTRSPIFSTNFTKDNVEISTLSNEEFDYALNFSANELLQMFFKTES